MDKMNEQLVELTGKKAKYRNLPSLEKSEAKRYIGTMESSRETFGLRFVSIITSQMSYHICE